MDAVLFEEQKLVHPWSLVCAGPSQCGKTLWTIKLLKNINLMSSIPPKQILWCYSEYQPSYQLLAGDPRIKFIKGIPSETDLKGDKSPRLLILDDLMGDSSKEVNTLFCRGVHHWNLSVVYIVQNLFFNGLRTARINAQHVVLFKNPSDQLQISTLAKQLYPGNNRMLLEAYKDACREPYSYLCLNLSQNCPEELRITTKIFPNEITEVYCP